MRIKGLPARAPEDERHAAANGRGGACLTQPAPAEGGERHALPSSSSLLVRIQSVYAINHCQWYVQCGCYHGLAGGGVVKTCHNLEFEWQAC